MRTEDLKALTIYETHVILLLEKMLTELTAIRGLLQMEQP
jgi:hypothetical protein